MRAASVWEFESFPGSSVAADEGSPPHDEPGPVRADPGIWDTNKCAIRVRCNPLPFWVLAQAFTQAQHIPQAIPGVLWEKWETSASLGLGELVFRLVRFGAPRFRKRAGYSSRLPYGTLRRFPLFRTQLRVLLVYLYLFSYLATPRRAERRTARSAPYEMRRAKGAVGVSLSGSLVAEFTELARFSTRTSIAG